MVKDIIKKITVIHHYKVTGDYWARIGKICQRYGEDTVSKAIEIIPERPIPLTQLLNIIERKCQYILENGELDDLANEILNS